MGLFGKKPRKLDAICAKLKQINQESPPPSIQPLKDENQSVPNEKLKNGSSAENDKDSADSLASVSNNKNHETSNRIETLNKSESIISKSVTVVINEADSSTTELNTPTLQSKSLPIVTPSGSSRRKSRKALVPRNINQVREFYDQYDSIDEKDELAEYEINNQNTNFPPDEELDEFEKDTSTSGHESLELTNGDDSNSSSFSSKHSNGHARHNSSHNSLGYNSFSTAPLDLSVPPRHSISSHNGYLSSDEDEDEDEEDDDINNNKAEQLNCKNIEGDPKTPRDLSFSGSKKKLESQSKEHTANLKDYAESTMNELISMYGFGGSQEHGAASKHFPMLNYNAILQQAQLAMLSAKDGDHFAALSQGVAKVQQPIKPGEAHVAMATQALKIPVVSTGGTNKVEGGRPLTDKFTNSAAYINTVFNASGPQTVPPKATVSVSSTPNSKNVLPDYSKYLKRFNHSQECGGSHCKDLAYKEHYHCIDCNFQVFIKKEEMVRHYKWHKKREESLQHGFLRFSPLDDCTQKFGPCTHNGRQTHYHCLQSGCDKVYISTSDVQMHANYHRKDSAIIQEGFQRFRATEDCGTPTCSFYGQRTTHFHCRRSNCKFTFKNKADMEKHKSYHQKDEILGRDGFKKFMKYEHCSYAGCRYSKISNHIHCIRGGCNYVLHSTAQLYSHKRKHERRDFENAYRKYREDQTRPPLLPAGTSATMPAGGIPKSEYTTITHMKGYPGNPGIIPGVSPMKRSADQIEPLELKKPKLEPQSGPSSPVPSDGASTPFEAFTPLTEGQDSSMEDDASNMSDTSGSNIERTHLSGESLNSSLNLPISLIQKAEVKSTVSVTAPVTMISPANMPGTGLFMQGTPVLQPPKTVYMERREKDDSWKNYLVRYTANDPCNPHCQYLYKDHYHCKMEGCLVLFKSKDGVREHARFHELQDRITPIAYREYDHQKACPEDCQYSCKEKHYHCIWSGCTHVVPHIGPTFGRLEHYRIHEYARAAAGKSYSRTAGKGLDDNGMKRRGRPPKYPKSDLPKIPKVVLTDEEIRKSHMNLLEGEVPRNIKVINGFRMFSLEDPCPDRECNFYGSTHYHCARPRCYTITDRIDVLNLHAKDFHSFVKILDGFEFFDRAVSCRRMHCPNNQTNRHFHCTRPRCDYSFVRHSTMAQHDKKHTSSDGKTSNSHSKVDLSSRSFVAIAPATSAVSSATLMSVKPAGQNIALSPIMAHTGTTPVLAHASSTPILAHTSTGLPILATIPQTSMNITPSKTSLNVSPASLTVSPIQALPASVTPPQLLSAVNSPLVSAGGVVSLPLTSASTAIPLTMLLQKGGNEIPQPSWTDLKTKMHFSISQNCGRPFCKLKKKDHYHCFECNQAFSDPARLRSHIGKHGIKFKRSEIGTRVVKPQNVPVSIAPRPGQLLPANPMLDDLDPDEEKCLAEGGDMSGDSDDEDELKNSSSLNLNPSKFSEMITKAQEENRITVGGENSAEGTAGHVDGSNSVMNTSTEEEDGAVFDESCDPNEPVSLSRSGRKRTKTKHEDFVDSNAINLKQRRVSSPRGSKDDSVPPGYVRSRYNEDCNYAKCTYRQSVTHFHCMREDCGYGFSDRSRLVQHTLRHERIDSITGGEMQQYRINQNCGREDCEFNNKMSHFHCLRCVYCCTDSSKVLTHRKQHAKQDEINSQGFQKYSVTESCGNQLCAYSQKQTHYHCLLENCKAAILGPAQMSPHKMKHS